MLPAILVPMQLNAGEQEKQPTATVTWTYLTSPGDPSEDLKLRFIHKADRMSLNIKACVSKWVFFVFF